jgi:hypothetical protein
MTILYQPHTAEPIVKTAVIAVLLLSLASPALVISSYRSVSRSCAERRSMQTHPAMQRAVPFRGKTEPPARHFVTGQHLYLTRIEAAFGPSIITSPVENLYG